MDPHRSDTEGVARVIAFHCSGAGAGEWNNLAAALGDGFALTAPEHYGSASTGAWNGEHAFTLADEAAQTLALIDSDPRRVHLVGHSYGGGVALHVALARPQKIASVALYEPSAFHLLRQMGERGHEAYAEIVGLAQQVWDGVLTGDYRSAVARFIDYWNGAGAWDAMRPSLQKNIMRWAPKGPLEFRALIGDATPATAYRRLTIPVLVMRGEHAPMPTRVIANRLAGLLPIAQAVVIEGAGHMGPLTHASAVSAWIVEHIAAVERAASARRDIAGPAARQICGAHLTRDRAGFIPSV